MNQPQTRENVHSGLSGLKDDAKWKNCLNLRFSDRRTKVVPKKFCLLTRDAGFHTIINGLGGTNYALGSRESWGFVGAERLCFYKLWRLRQEYLGEFSDRSEASQRLFVQGSYTGDTPLRIRVTVVAGRLVLDTNWPEAPPALVAPPQPDYGCDCNCSDIELAGLVLNSTTLAPLQANIELTRDGVIYYVTSSNVDGEYLIENIIPNIYVLTITLDGYVDYTQTIEIAASGNRTDYLDIIQETIACSAIVTSGGQGYEEFVINLGTDIGTCTLTFNAFTVPDRFEVIWNATSVIDTGYRGDNSYDAALALLGLPPTTGLGSGTASFVKTLAAPNLAILRVYAPLESTVWDATLGCPVP
jgi:hypothetical protein